MSLVVAASLIALPATAGAHAELRQASPRVGSTVGGEFHSIAMLFTGLDEVGAFQAELLDPAGNSIGAPPVSDDGRIVIPIEPLTVPGTYTVTYTTTGIDRDVVSDAFTFRFDPSQPPPEGIDLALTRPSRFEVFDYLLILGAAAIAGYLVHRVRMAMRPSPVTAQPAD